MNSVSLTDVLSVLPLETILWSILGLLFVGFAFYSMILLWHWKAYSTGRFTTVASMFTYLVVGSVLLAIMALAVVWLSAV